MDRRCEVKCCMYYKLNILLSDIELLFLLLGRLEVEIFGQPLDSDNSLCGQIFLKHFNLL